MVEAWNPLATLRDPGFQWDGSDYPIGARHTPIDVGLLENHKPALVLLVQLAKTGYPSHGSVREALEMLQEKHQVIKGPKEAMFPKLNDAATRWRMMCKAIYTLKSNDANHASIQEAIDLIELPH